MQDLTRWPAFGNLDMKPTVVLPLLLMLAGCATGLPSVSYTGPVTAHSTKTAVVSLQTGEVDVLPISPVLPNGQVWAPIPITPNPKIGIVTVVGQPADGVAIPDWAIDVTFDRTTWNPNEQQYLLDVTLKIQGHGDSLVQSYHIDSAEGDSQFVRENTTGRMGKTKGADKLMVALVTDIQKWVAAHP
jgi:hypothetical protein